jgi:thiamine kinase-like enzyme
MAAEIPAAERLSAPPAWALARVPGLEHGEPPRAVMRLTGGSVNQVFRIDSASGRFVLRLDGAAWRRPGVDRGREWLLHRAAAAAGIAPAIVYADPQAHGLLISQYQEGRLWSDRDFEDLASLRRLGERLQALHRLPAPEIAPFDPWSVAQDYVKEINKEAAGRFPEQQLREPLSRLQRNCELVRANPAATSIVHGDLAHGNLLEGSRLWLLDWEYAQRSDPLMDVACVLAYYPRAQAHGAELAAASGLSAAARNDGLSQRIYIYQALVWLWHLARGEAASPP